MNLAWAFFLVTHAWIATGAYSFPQVPRAYSNDHFVLVGSTNVVKEVSDIILYRDEQKQDADLKNKREATEKPKTATEAENSETAMLLRVSKEKNFRSETWRRVQRQVKYSNKASPPVQVDVVGKDTSPWSRPNRESKDEISEHSSKIPLDRKSSAKKTDIHISKRKGTTQKLISRKRRSRSRRKRDQIRNRREPTSKFTGLVVGASANKKLDKKVKSLLNSLYKDVWDLQSNVTQSFQGGKKTKYASIQGAFPSFLKTNYHGCTKETRLRDDKDLSVPDSNSLATLMVLHCLVEAAAYGRADNPDHNKMRKAVTALEEFHTRNLDKGNTILTLWPEKLGKNHSGWVIYPENPIKADVKGGKTTFDTLESLAEDKESCSSIKKGLSTIKSSELCTIHYNTTLAEASYDVSRPPDLMTSLSNLALGSLFLAKKRGAHGKGDAPVFSAEMEIWNQGNSDVSILVEKLKEMAVVFCYKKTKDRKTPTDTTQTYNTTATRNTVSVTPGSDKNASNKKAVSAHSTAIKKQSRTVSTLKSAAEIHTSKRTMSDSNTSASGTKPSNSRPSSTVRKTESTKSGQTNGTYSVVYDVDIKDGESKLHLKDISVTVKISAATSSKARSSKTYNLDHKRKKTRDVRNLKKDSRSTDKNLRAKTTEGPKNEHSALNATMPSRDVLLDETLDKTSSSNMSLSIAQATHLLTSKIASLTSISPTSKTQQITPTKIPSTIPTIDNKKSTTPIAEASDKKDIRKENPQSVPDTIAKTVTKQSSSQKVEQTLPKPDKTKQRTQVHSSQNTKKTVPKSRKPNPKPQLGPEAHDKKVSKPEPSQKKEKPSLKSQKKGPTSKTTNHKQVSIPKDKKTKHPKPSTASAAPNHSTASLHKDHVNQILDSMSYYGLRNYLNESQTSEDVVLIPLWISDTQTDAKKKLIPGDLEHNEKQARRYNEVDLSTIATASHALVVSSMTTLVDLRSDSDLKLILRSSLKILTWYINHENDLLDSVALSPFPSRYQLYWLLSRIGFQLQSRQAVASKLFEFDRSTIQLFLSSLREKMTFAILQSITDAGIGTDGKTRVYIDDVLGVKDVDAKGKTKVSGDDRVFSSAMALNALIATWTIQQEDGSLKFINKTIDGVRIAVNSLVNYVSGAVMDKTQSHDNVFMAELVKHCQMLPALFPANIVTSQDGKPSDPKTDVDKLRFGVQGYIATDDYNTMLKKTLSGLPAPDLKSLRDLNRDDALFYFWSSPAYTKAAVLLAIAQASNLEIDPHKFS